MPLSSLLPSWSLSTFDGSDHSSPPNEISSQRQQREEELATSRSTKRASRQQCPLCTKSYDRSDHLSRHLQSHDNTRPFQCARCGKGFNRFDLLKRHTQAHFQDGAKGSTTNRTKERTAQACKGCVAAKTKCEDEKPCKRCQTRKIPCMFPSTTATSKHPAHSSTSHLHSPAQSHRSYRSPSTETPEIQNPFEQTSPSGIACEDLGSAMGGPSSRELEDFNNNSEAISLTENRTYDVQPDVNPSFFEQIMISQQDNATISMDLAIPPDVSIFVQDMDFSLDDFDFQILEPFPTIEGCSDISTGNVKEGQILSPLNSTLSLRADAFQLSPWEWVPPRKHPSLSKQGDISINEACEGGVPPVQEFQAPLRKQCLTELLDFGSRDRIFKMVLSICSFSHGISSFPSQNLLAKMMQAFYMQEAESFEARVPLNTMSIPQSTRPELLLAIIASGAVTVSSDAIQRMGIAFQEVVRLAVAELFEHDNSLTRDLQALQAYMLWLDVGLWSGYKRSMEISGGFLQPLYILLIKAKAFARDNDLAVEVHSGDSAEVIEALWQDWRAKESWKRIGIQAFLHDSRSSLALLRSPIISYAQLSVSLPCPRDLWMAPDSQIWAGLLTSGTVSIQSQSLTLIDVFSNIETLDGKERMADVHLCLKTALHAIAAQVWNYRQQSSFCQNPGSSSDETAQMLRHALQNYIYEALTKLRLKCDTFGQGSPEVIMLAEFLMMFLNVSLDDVQRFAGKDGERVAREIVPSMRKWCHSKEARRAIWHAGQVLRAAKSFQPAQLKGFHAVAFYFSSLTLWVYGLIINDANLNSGLRTPMRNELLLSHSLLERHEPREVLRNGLNSPHDDSTVVILDGVDGQKARFFINFNQGQPGLTPMNGKYSSSVLSNSTFCSLHLTQSVLLNASSILQANYTNKSSSPPLMVRTLLELMKKLAEL